MESFNKKFRLIVLPFLATSIVFSALYTFLVWLLITGSGIVSLKENIFRYWIPLFLAFLIVYTVLLPRFRKLHIGTAMGSAAGLMFLVAVMATAAPAIFIQEYSRVSSGRITSLKNIKAIEFNAPTKYYTAESFYVDKRHPVTSFSQERTGSLGESVRLKILVSTPMVAVRADTLSGQCPAWMCLEYEKQVSSLISEEERIKIFNQFVEQCKNEYIKRDFKDAKYFRRADKGEENNRFAESISTNKYYRHDSENFLIPVFEPFRERKGSLLLWILLSFVVAAAVLVVMILKTKPAEEALTEEPGTSNNSEEDQESILDLLTPGGNYLVTPIIALVNTVIFVAMVCAGLGFLSFKPEDLVAWGANYQPYVTEGQWWRLISCIFTHGGFFDLIASIYALVFIGLLLEPKIGKLSFIIIYLISGVIGGCISVWVNSNIVSGGSSAAIFGLYGVFIAFLIGKAFRSKIRDEIIISIIFYIGYNILYGLNNGIFDFALVGGVLSGLLLGFPLLQWLNNTDTRRRNPVIVYLMAGWLLLLSAGAILLKHNPKDRFKNMMNEFTIAETKALDNLNQAYNISDLSMVDSLEIKGINDWKKCIKITERMDGIENLPPELVEKKELLKKYCDYRIESYKLTASYMRTSHTIDERMLDQYNEKIGLIIKKLHGSDIPDSLLKITPITETKTELLYVVDGKPMEDPGKILPENIKSLTILKPDAAIKVYGEKGKNGAIIITMK
ncbi:MAG TPA: rhomboid family intramembrane serine protease [Bacteroidales bacterium]|mgnify:CR=1 FL=1|nr:rhomboid family intramembrane serine protease [Bacteroidales bacterium]